MTNSSEAKELEKKNEALLEACRSAKLAMETSGLSSGYGAKVYDRICQTIAQAEGR